MTAETPGDPMVKHLVAGGYVLMPNEAINDERLSFRARGVLLYLLGRPPGWVFNAARVAQHGKEGRDAVGAAMRELTEAGYYRWRRIQTPNGFRMKTEVAALPSLMPPLPTAPPGSGSSGSGKSGSGRAASGPPVAVVTTDTSTTESQNPPAPSEQAPPLEVEPVPTAKRRGTRLPADWSPSDDLRKWTFDQGVLMQEITSVIEVFVDYWIAQPGQKGSKVDWDATWRNWVRRDLADRAAQARREAGRQTPQERDRAILEASLQRGLAARQQNHDQPAIEGPRKTPWT